MIRHATVGMVGKQLQAVYRLHPRSFFEKDVIDPAIMTDRTFNILNTVAVNLVKCGSIYRLEILILILAGIHDVAISP